VLALRREEPALRHDRWFQHAPSAPGERSLTWLTPSSHVMQVHDWHGGGQHAFACRIDASPKNAQATPSGCSHLLIAFNPEATPLPFTLPPGQWLVALDSAGEHIAGHRASAHQALVVPAHALVVLRDSTPPESPRS
jgi:glycogen operon protein